MAASRAVDFELRDLEVALGDADVEILLERAIDPVVGDVGLGQRRDQTRPELLQLLRIAPDDRASAVTRLSYSLRTVISCATIASYFACASLVSVIVATPTSKLRFACASCSDHRLLLAFGELDVELREQDVEVRDRDADDQVLLRASSRT